MTFLIGLVACLVLGMTNPAAAELRLVEDGRSAFAILIRKQCAAPERYAAEELQSHLEAMTGARLPIQDSRSVAADVLLISRTSGAEGVADSGRPEEAEAFHYRIGANGVLIQGGGPRGLLYGVYGFLEHLGCRWFTPSACSSPTAPTPGTKTAEFCSTM